MLTLRDLVVDILGSRVLRGISLEINAGELVCLVGRNGAGKTTMFRTLMGFRKPTSGSIMFDKQYGFDAGLFRRSYHGLHDAMFVGRRYP